jgi:hypothetical protein
LLSTETSIKSDTDRGHLRVGQPRLEEAAQSLMAEISYENVSVRSGDTAFLVAARLLSQRHSLAASHLMARGCISFSSSNLLLARMPASLARLRASLAAFVERPCRQLPFFTPVGAPLLLPPCNWHRLFDFKAGLRQGAPDRVFAPHLSPGQSSPNLHSLNLG